MSDEAAPIRHMVDLGKLSLAGSRAAVSAKGDERAALARWLEVEAVNAFNAAVTLRRVSQAQFALEGDIAAEIVQNCVVTLEPMTTRIERHFVRELHYTPRVHVEGGILTLSAGDEDVPEEIDHLDYDLAVPVLEELVLAIDPYPRKDGTSFAPPQKPDDAPESPFAVLKRLKPGG